MLAITITRRQGQGRMIPQPISVISILFGSSLLDISAIYHTDSHSRWCLETCRYEELRWAWWSSVVQARGRDTIMCPVCYPYNTNSAITLTAASAAAAAARGGGSYGHSTAQRRRDVVRSTESPPSGRTPAALNPPGNKTGTNHPPKNKQTFHFAS